MRKMNLLSLSCYLILSLLSTFCSSLMAGENKVVFYRDDFEDGKADQWKLGKGWKMETDPQ